MLFDIGRFFRRCLAWSSQDYVGKTCINFLNNSGLVILSLKRINLVPCKDLNEVSSWIGLKGDTSKPYLEKVV